MMMAKDGEVALLFQPLLGLAAHFSGVSREPSGRSDDRGQFDDLEPTLTRHGYHLSDLVQQFDAKPTEIKALFSNQLDPTRTAALRDRMLRAGLPL